MNNPLTIEDVKTYTEYEEAFDGWFYSMLNLATIFPSESNPFRTCLQRDVIRDPEVKKALRQSYIKTMMRVEDPELYEKLYDEK